MNLRTEHFSLRLDPLHSVDSEDWVRVQAFVEGGVFSGSFEAYLQLEDLKRFGQCIERMYAEVGSSHEAVLSCHEPGIYVRLRSNHFGQVEGNYSFETEDGSFAKLTGSFRIDQSFLPMLSADTHELVASLSEDVA